MFFGLPLRPFDYYYYYYYYYFFSKTSRDDTTSTTTTPTTTTTTNSLPLATMSITLLKLQSRKSKEELDMRSQMVDNLKKEVQELKALTLAGYVKNYDKNRISMVVNIEQSDAFSGMGECICVFCRCCGFLRAGY